MTPRALLWCGGLAVALAACDQPSFPTDPSPPGPVDTQLRQELARWNVAPIGDMPSQDPALVALGRALMFDKILSGNRDVSCATCHDPAMHGGDGLSLSVGTGGMGSGAERTPGPGRQFGPRNAPSLLNEGLRSQFVFWDGRVAGFQAGPFTAPPGIKFPAGLSNILAAPVMVAVLPMFDAIASASEYSRSAPVLSLCSTARSPAFMWLEARWSVTRRRTSWSRSPQTRTTAPMPGS